MCPLPTAQALCSAPTLQRVCVSFHPRGLSPPRWLAPHRRSRACCISLPAVKFVAFPASEDHRTTVQWHFVALPATLAPLEGFPFSAAVPHHCGRSHLDLTHPCVSARLRPADKSASPHVTECRAEARAQTLRSRRLSTGGPPPKWEAHHAGQASAIAGRVRDAARFASPLQQHGTSPAAVPAASPRGCRDRGRAGSSPPRRASCLARSSGRLCDSAGLQGLSPWRSP